MENINGTIYIGNIHGKMQLRGLKKKSFILSCCIWWKKCKQLFHFVDVRWWILFIFVRERRKNYTLTLFYLSLLLSFIFFLFFEGNISSQGRLWRETYVMSYNVAEFSWSKKNFVYSLIFSFVKFNHLHHQANINHFLMDWLSYSMTFKYDQW